MPSMVASFGARSISSKSQLMNPYASPNARGHASPREPRRSPWRFFIGSLFLYPVWFFVGGAFSISGSERDMAIDSGLLVAVVGASIVAFLIGVVGEIRNG